MILPSQERCRQVVEELADEPALTQWQADFIASNRGRLFYTDRQREVIGKMIEDYDV